MAGKESGQPDANSHLSPVLSPVNRTIYSSTLQIPPDPPNPPVLVDCWKRSEITSPLRVRRRSMRWRITSLSTSRSRRRRRCRFAPTICSSQGGWSDITSAPAFAASIVSRLAKRAGKGANGIPGVARALCERGVPSAQTVWAYLKAEGLVEEYDDAKFDALQEALLRECKWDKSLEHLASELKRAKVGYIRRQAREATRD